MRNTDSRKSFVAKNVSAAIAGQVVNIILSFVSRTVFIYVLGKTYLGVNGLFSNILTVLSLAELGIGEAIVFKLYKAIADNDIEKIKSYMAFFRKAYMIIGLTVSVLGLSLIPFLQVFISGGEGIDHLRIIYVLYISNTVSTYFLGYKQLIITAHQRGYVVTFFRFVFVAVQHGLQILVLLMTKNFILYLSVQIVCNVLLNLCLFFKAGRMYPYLKEKTEPLSKEDSKEVFKQTSALVAHKVGGVAVSGTDNILISSFVGIDSVGIYSNYVTLIGIPQTLLAYVFSPMVASIGNLIHTSSDEHVRETFNKLLLINFWLYGFCSICLFSLINPFVGKIWIDDSYVFGYPIVLFICLNFYLSGMRQVVSQFKASAGLYWNDRFRPLIEAAVNLGASIVLLKLFGLIGVIVGTTISMVTTTFWVEAVIVYKNVLKVNPWKFFLKYAGYLLILFGVGITNFGICEMISVDGVWMFLLRLCICVAFPNAVFFLCFFKTKEFKELWNNDIKRVLKKVFKKDGESDHQ